MRNSIARQLPLIMLVALTACVPLGASPSQRPVADGASGPTGPQRTLAIAIRGELPTLAVKPLVQFSGALNPPLFLFNAMLDYADERDAPHPMLAEALPRLNTDTWRVFPDGKMETTFRLRPDLSWHDGTPMTSEDLVFTRRANAARMEWGLSVSSISPIEERAIEAILAPDPRTVVIRWRQLYPDAMSQVWAVRYGIVQGSRARAVHGAPSTSAANRPAVTTGTHRRRRRHR